MREHISYVQPTGGVLRIGSHEVQITAEQAAVTHEFQFNFSADGETADTVYFETRTISFTMGEQEGINDPVCELARHHT